MQAIQIEHSDSHMAAAMHLSEALREAHLCKLYASKVSKRSEPDLFGERPYAGQPKQSRHAGYEICEHLLASLRQQVVDERAQVSEQTRGEKVEESKQTAESAAKSAKTPAKDSVTCTAKDSDSAQHQLRLI